MASGSTSKVHTGKVSCRYSGRQSYDTTRNGEGFSSLPSAFSGSARLAPGYAMTSKPEGWPATQKSFSRHMSRVNVEVGRTSPNLTPWIALLSPRPKPAEAFCKQVSGTLNCEALKPAADQTLCDCAAERRCTKRRSRQSWDSSDGPNGILRDLLSSDSRRGVGELCMAGLFHCSTASIGTGWRI